MLLTNQLVPNLVVTDFRGQSHELWSYRQKTSLLLIVEPGASVEALEKRAADAETHQKTWDWLGVKLIVVKETKMPLDRGAYAIDRYGRMIKKLIFDDEIWTKAEKEFIYHEAGNC